MYRDGVVVSALAIRLVYPGSVPSQLRWNFSSDRPVSGSTQTQENGYQGFSWGKTKAVKTGGGIRASHCHDDILTSQCCDDILTLQCSDDLEI